MPARKTNPDAIPGFDAVAESRKWREATSRKLDAMDLDERIAYLHAARERYLAGREKSCMVREDPPES